MTDEQAIIYVVDDDPSVRMSLDGLLRSAGLIAQCFGSTEEFLKAQRLDAPACLILDVRMPGRSGLDFQLELSEAQIEIPIVFITGHGDIPMSVRAMKSGAIEFLTKPFRDQDLLDAIYLGLDKDRLRRRSSATLADLRRRFSALTPRERQVMALVAKGQLNKQVATALSIGEVTVKVHRAQVMRKMRAVSLVELARMADVLDLGAAKARGD